MRSCLALGLLILCASAGAATAQHSRHDVIVQRHEYAIPGWTYAAPPPIDYDDTPNYNDPSKFGGGTALPVTR